MRDVGTGSEIQYTLSLFYILTDSMIQFLYCSCSSSYYYAQRSMQNFLALNFFLDQKHEFLK